MSAMEDKILWIGGTSSLTRTFVNCQLLNPKRLVLVGLESRAPDWIPPSSRYISFNLATATDEQARDLVQSIINDVSCIVIGVRPLLFAPYTQTDLPQRMLQGVEKLLEQACHQEASKLKLVLHVSSVAAMDHLRTQHFVSEAEDYPPIVEYKASYDKFKRLCEERITSIVDKANQGRNTAKILVCNFRISAIFSDETSCFQCTAINLQARVSCYVDHKIDCNSSVNVSRAMYAVMERASSNNQEGTNKKIQPVYYYTRPLSLKQPVAWGYYLQLFRRVHQMEYTSIWIPVDIG
ncbi:expressed unknown protein [Seminavis robusta]|uniref:3-beta hydroxysteroid dehydrogenase/isomerase domain-containing protein n=1 Tax=Seminavis robusta TaxID=568900 RepID=A0A9N8E3Q0_9STRA|nr:expressed unknown protein [Seminavis robusta]|eukprot:Sro587_g171370.1 n/a (294) ;mRNA; r:46963-48056